MVDTEKSPAFSTFARISFCMAVLSCVFWFTSWPPHPVSIEFPNCVSARLDSQSLAIGCLSHNRSSSLFLTTQNLDPGYAVWSERPDGHFCGFPIPPREYPGQPSGLNIHLGLDTIGWDCPYWLMIILWSAVFFKSRSRNQYCLRDIFLSVTVLAIVLTLIRLKLALLLVVLLNISTVLLLVLLAISSVVRLIKADNPWWPLVIVNNS